MEDPSYQEYINWIIDEYDDFIKRLGYTPAQASSRSVYENIDNSEYCILNFISRMVITMIQLENGTLNISDLFQTSKMIKEIHLYHLEEELSTYEIDDLKERIEFIKENSNFSEDSSIHENWTEFEIKTPWWKFWERDRS